MSQGDADGRTKSEREVKRRLEWDRARKGSAQFLLH
jgi:hypothetical protein